jgi:hypothetical protein
MKTEDLCFPLSKPYFLELLMLELMVFRVHLKVTLEMQRWMH